MKLELKLDTSLVRIEEGELVGFQVEGHEFIHQKGSPGWRNSDTEMFPIIGPTVGADFQVKTPKGNAVQDQHGLLRELSYEVFSKSAATIIYQKAYKANTKVSNSKYPDESKAKELYWPYDFRFQKSFSLSAGGLEISFRIEGEDGMLFMLGYHPAFKLQMENASIKTESKTISIEEVIAVGSRALQISNCNKIFLKDKEGLTIKTEGFGNFMLWTEVSNMVCIEPITFYPYAVEANQLHSGFNILGKSGNEFKVFLKPE